ncbi:MAG TPA: putative toxin [Gemmatimonadaceae bacterium]
MSRKSAGMINTAPFTLSYNLKGELTSWNTTLPSSRGQYDQSDDLSQQFTSGRLLRQSEIISDPTTGGVSLQLAARHYYGADDRLMAVQRYSYKSMFSRDGTWEEYWYDALGRRVFTRTRREQTSPYQSTVSGPLCMESFDPICRSFTERVWWDGDQSLVEKRTPEGTSDASNSGTVGNVNALTLDEPLAVITTNPVAETRIINYNWRGQAMSAVFPDGEGADYLTGSISAEVDWPSFTQAETYFTPNLDGQEQNYHAKKWLGTFVQNGQGTTGMLYERNRYFDTKTGRFTQEDPIGIAGGVNQYGFAEGDPVNFSDPFGLSGCDKKTGEGCSDEYKRLLETDKPLEAPLIDPVAIGSGMLGGMLFAPAQATAISGSNAIGRAGEAAVHRAANIGEKIAIRVGGRTRIPDGLTNMVLTEVKNVRSLSYTQQLRDFTSYAQSKGLRFDLWVRKGAELSGPLQQAIRNGAINLRIIP